MSIIRVSRPILFKIILPCKNTILIKIHINYYYWYYYNYYMVLFGKEIMN